MNFFNLTGHFFKQLENAIAIDQSTVNFDYKTHQKSITLKKPFVKSLCDKYDIDFPFEPDKYIINIDQLRRKEAIPVNDAIETIQAIKILYWYTILIIPEEIERLFENEITSNSLTETIIDQEKTKAKLSLETKYKLKRRRIYDRLIKHIDTRTHQRNYPNPYEVAMNYHNNSKHEKYNHEVIAPVMERTKIYLQAHPDLKTTYWHVKPIREKCKDLEGGKDAKENWIKHYAKKSGLKNHKI